MRLSLVVPGLLWPEPVLSDTVRDLRLPALEALLGLGDRQREAGLEVADFWRGLFGEASPAAAPLRLLEAGLPPGNDTWVCVDPVHLLVDQQGIRLDDPTRIALTADEADALATTLAPLWEGYGQLHTSPAGWHLRIDGPTPDLPASLVALVGRPARELLPEGDGGKPWRRLMNEVQMALHDHPVNLARAATGQPVVTSLAFWGGGTLGKPVPAQSHLTLSSPEQALRGCALHAGARARLLPDNFGKLPAELFTSGTAVLHLAALEIPTRLRDALRWREALESLERDWFAPALAALRQQRMENLALHGFGEGSHLALQLKPADRWKFWRRPAALTELHP